MKKILVLGKNETGLGASFLLDKLKIPYDISNTFELTNYDYNIVIKSPGIKPDNEVLKKLSKNSIIISDLELSYLIFPKKKYIAVTGTNGKTTTVMLLEKLLDKKNFKACGNIGKSILHENSNNLIVECSSFQLKYIDKFKPNIAVLLNISKAHVDYHKSYSNYIKDKLNLVKNHPSLLVINKDDLILNKLFSSYLNVKTFSLKSEKATCYIKGNYIYYKRKKYLKINKIKANSNYNLLNIMASIIVAKILKVKNKKIKKIVKNFKPAKYRMEKIKKNIYNDAKSTNPISTLEAIKSLNGNIYLISGGINRSEVYDVLSPIFSKLKKVFVYGESAQVQKKFFLKNNLDCESFSTLNEALLKLIKERTNEIILFSPMCASWDQYKSYIERGKEFEEFIIKNFK